MEELGMENEGKRAVRVFALGCAKEGNVFY